MLAAPCSTVELETLRYPLLASTKLDGLRLLCHPTLGPVTRRFKPLPNVHARGLLSHELLKGLDGELMMRDPVTGKFLGFNDIQSALMTRDGKPQFEYHVFDYFANPTAPYKDRMYTLLQNIWHIRRTLDNSPQVYVLEQHLIVGVYEAHEFAAKCLQEGFEGIVLRDSAGPYKSNRSTLKQQWMVKYKGDMEDAEGIVVGFEELFRNQNPQVRSELGLSDRSDHKSGMVPADTLGALVLNTELWGEVKVGSGMDTSTRDWFWTHRTETLGKSVTFKYTPFGMKDKPRFPIYKAIRLD